MPGAQLPGQRQRGHHIEARRAPAEGALFSGQSTAHREGFFLVDGADFGDAIPGVPSMDEVMSWPWAMG
jgi:hypothetical protein